MDRRDFQWMDHVATPIFLIEVGDDDVPRFVCNNKTHSRMSGLASEVLESMTAPEIFPGRPSEHVFERHCQVVRTRERTTYDLMFNFPSGERTLRTTLDPIADADGKVRFIVGTMLDSAAEHAARAAEVEAQARHFEAMRETEQFIAMAAHDLRALLRQVSGISSMLREELTDLGENERELFDMLDDVSQRAAKVIAEVLSYAQSVSKEIETNRFDFGELCEALIVLLDPLAKHRVTISPALLDADEMEMEMAMKLVLRNLVENIVKHAGNDGLEITLAAQPASGGMIAITVSDNGVGFDDPAIAFLDGWKFRHETGFGLLGIRQLIHARGGEIEARHPDVGTGAVIRFTLPGQIIAASS